MKTPRQVRNIPVRTNGSKFENIAKMRGSVTVTAKGTSPLGSLDRTTSGRKTHLKDAAFDGERMWQSLRGAFVLSRVSIITIQEEKNKVRLWTE